MNFLEDKTVYIMRLKRFVNFEFFNLAISQLSSCLSAQSARNIEKYGKFWKRGTDHDI